ncbi:MAG: hypothetical protein MOGMAGMI_01996 [Candidatus Omnitrophica bacterium]|nr:hypothetical protein [Candidatus Omnitrophota bacterium]
MKEMSRLETILSVLFPKAVERLEQRAWENGRKEGVISGHERTKENAARYAEKCALNFPPALCRHLAENLRRLKHPDEVKGGAV